METVIIFGLHQRSIHGKFDVFSVTGTAVIQQYKLDSDAFETYRSQRVVRI